ncbi:HSF-type DNA-binding family protein [Clavispora lusitaniae]|uniref:Transcription factor n=2 Tax=Clavispora lusitaniae TaxID=36911 RepID=C4Y5I4_CLAL4|nr:uncharacterized protein CLUG_03418 [Clavispora lusitaniae ATCC 42720]ACB38711.1 Skn7 [Clavispora lusitaniae]EEQ39290.1 hypothetical protein CLUG_03418 [Clavispora lusitaniae ATCC 42720]KAF5210192.1 kinase-regulated stress-responsive transcription factor skn7 [Clavispora lusitaniae]KAF7582732.1 HSF-type DNA-binding family protein [Clavispora lusitaniae]
MATRKDDTGGSNDFVKKLFTMLSEDRYYDVVRWTAGGNSFVVLNTNEFTKEILPRHFKHSNFASFVRQLNKYDFHKVKISTEEKRSYQYGDDAWEFQHPDFRKDDRDALDNIRRKAPLKKDAAYEANPHYDAQLSSLRTELSNVQADLRTLSDKYRALVESMVAVNSYNERQYRSIGVLVHCLNQAGIKIPPLDLPSPNLLGLVSPPRAVDKPVKSEPELEKTASLHTSPKAPQGSAQPHSGGAPPSQSSSVPPHSGAVQPQAGPAGPHSGVQPHGGAQTSTPSAPVSFEPVDGSTPKFHVLLVEDDNVCIQLCRKFLMKYGCQVTVVTDGLNAISTVEHTKYDLVLMDIVMPNLDGATATSIIRSFDTKTPIIAMTGNIQDNDLVTYLQNGMSDILAKPFTKDDLYSILSKHLLASPKNFEQPGEFQLPLEEGMSQPMEMPMQPLSPINQPIAQPMGQSIARPIMELEQPTKKQRMQ